MTYLGPRIFALEVALGKVPGYSPINKFGEAPDCDSGVSTDIWDGADGVPTGTDIWVPPTQARIHDIVSSDVNDDGSPVGTGMRTVRVYGLTGWGTAEVSEDVILNGTTVVPTSNAYVIIHRMEGLTFGTGETNAGIIKATAQTDATVTAAIQTGMGQTLMLIYGVPSTQKIAIKTIKCAALRSASAVKVNGSLLVKLRADQADSAFVTKEKIQFSDVMSSTHDYTPPKILAGPCIIKIQVKTNLNNTVIAGTFDGLVVDN